jgi:hypothetical protein
MSLSQLHDSQVSMIAANPFGVRRFDPQAMLPDNTQLFFRVTQ